MRFAREAECIRSEDVRIPPGLRYSVCGNVEEATLRRRYVIPFVRISRFDRATAKEIRITGVRSIVETVTGSQTPFPISDRKRGVLSARVATRRAMNSKQAPLPI